MDKSRAQKIVTLLLRDKILIKISDELVFHRSALEELRRLVMTQKTKSSKMDVAKFKELTGVSRKYAIPCWNTSTGNTSRSGSETREKSFSHGCPRHHANSS